MLVQDNFKSIGEFVAWVDAHEGDCQNRHCCSEQRRQMGFTKLESFSQAKQLLIDGWVSKAVELTTKLKAKMKEFDNDTGRKSVYDVVGHQACVARYLQGIPTSMVRTISIPKHQKVVTLVKMNAYMADVSDQQIFDNSVKALVIALKLESMGYDVNLDILACSSVMGHDSALRVRVKSSTERMNIAKTAFPMIHSDMFRRLVFRYRENKKELGVRGMSIGYTNSTQRTIELGVVKKNEYLLEAFIGDIDETIAKMGLK